MSLSSSSVEDNSELPLLGSCDRLKRRRMIKPFQLHDEILCFREGIKPAKNINSGGGGDWEHLLFNSSLERVTGENGLIYLIVLFRVLIKGSSISGERRLHSLDGVLFDYQSMSIGCSIF